MLESGIQHSYILTNRNIPAAPDEPLPGDGLAFYEAPSAYNPDPTEYVVTATIASDLLSDLAAVAVGPQSALSAQLVVYIHGLANTFANAIQETAEFGMYLTSDAMPNYPQFGGGIVIGFDWPSFAFLQSIEDYGTIRTNIRNSVASFGTFLKFLTDVQLAAAQNTPPIQVSVNFICHSEGGYMMMEGMAGAKTPPAPFIDQVLLLAADINDAALESLSAGTNEGSGAQMAASANRVTVYYSPFDTDLIASDLLYAKYHNPSYPGRLGLTGPISYTTLEPNVFAVDCSKVINEVEEAYLKLKGYLPPTMDLHSSYRYVPQILTDMIQTLAGTAAGSVVDRVAEGTGSQQYTMDVNPQYAIHISEDGGIVRGGLASPLLKRSGLAVAAMESSAQ